MPSMAQDARSRRRQVDISAMWSERGSSAWRLERLKGTLPSRSACAAGLSATRKPCVAYIYMVRKGMGEA